MPRDRFFPDRTGSKRRHRRWLNPFAPASRRSAFTIVEAAVVVAGIALMATALYSSMTRINDFATANRLNSLATSVVADRIERSIAAPGFFFSGSGSVSNQTPTDLTTGTTSTAVALYVDPDISVSGTSAVNLQISNTGSATLAPSAFALITGTMTTAISDINPLAVTGTTTTVYLKQTSVTLTYKFRNRSFTVQMDTLRSPTM